MALDRIVVVSWKTTESHSGYYRVPGDFLPEDWDLNQVLSEVKEDTKFDGQVFERHSILVEDVAADELTEVRPQASVLPLAGHEVW